MREIPGGIRSTCPYCGVGCGIVATETADGWQVKGDPDHPANFGRLCSKGSALADTLIDSGRLTRPLVDGQPASWDAALDLVADRFARTIAEHGPDAVAFYVSGQCLTEDYYVANKLMKGFIGSGNIDTNSRLCMASSVAGHNRAFGGDVVPGCYQDLEEADLVVLVGSNLAWCHPVLFQRLTAARGQRGTKVVVIDPRRTASCEIADLHLALAPGSDVALFQGLLAHLAMDGRVATEWVQAHASGIEAALVAAAMDAGRVADITGLEPGEIQAFYRLFAEIERTVTVYSQGVNQSSAGTDKVNAIVNCHLATARIGRPGMGPFSVTGQPNAMGGREVGGLANQLAAHMSFADPAAIERVGRFWGAPNIATKPGMKAVELFEAVADGRVKALWIMATNPAVSLPRADRVRDALARCPFVVVSDCWPTDTTRYAHVTLPAAGWGEKDGTVTNSERRISRQRPFRLAPGEARPDWWMLAEVGKRLGRHLSHSSAETWAHAFTYDGPAAIFREHAALSGFENGGTRGFDIGGLAELSDATYDALEPVHWPVPASGPAGGRLFADGGFFTPDRKARFVAVRYRPPVAAATEAFPFLLNTGRIRDQWHTMTRTGLVPRLMSHRDEPRLALHPDDARRLGVDAGDLVRVTTAEGTAMFKAEPSAEQRPGELFAAMHWTDDFTASGPADRLVQGATDPVSGQPELKATAAAVEKVRARWRGLLVRRAGGALPRDFYWARVPVERGQAYELAGWDALPDGAALEAFAAALLAAPVGAERLEAVDARRGTYRYALLVEGRLEAWLILSEAEGAVVPARSLVAAQLGERVPDGSRVGVLAGAARNAPSVGRIVCSCFAVGIDTLRRAIAADGLASVAEIGAALKAGTNCGSCIPELKGLLEATEAVA
ncbi:nitrate reductase [Aliidongia dinghuensis]|uniref:Nitrate reductase n=1 Tax=Aliidongia dinghuensis TaxID=1867774 RepID=A0A8J2YQ88_9PROT|nr:nitrate reductase [Aliidongia dinghuensis]GGF06162.1 nitrate reductase [Aliidongia dinghuensis]